MTTIRLTATETALLALAHERRAAIIERADAGFNAAIAPLLATYGLTDGTRFTYHLQADGTGQLEVEDGPVLVAGTAAA